MARTKQTALTCGMTPRKVPRYRKRQPHRAAATASRYILVMRKKTPFRMLGPDVVRMITGLIKQSGFEQVWALTKAPSRRTAQLMNRHAFLTDQSRRFEAQLKRHLRGCVEKDLQSANLAIKTEMDEVEKKLLLRE